jgi:Ca2+-binding RTX toxin-like protein
MRRPLPLVTLTRLWTNFSFYQRRLAGRVRGVAGNLIVQDTTPGHFAGKIVKAPDYTGPVQGIEGQYIATSPDDLVLTAQSPSLFLHTGTGNDAISALSGTNILDGGTGSNFLVGGSDSDTFFVDDRGASADLWDTITNFHPGDAVTVWGVTPQDFNLAWVDGQGAAFYTGLTLHATAAGKPTASLTLAGFASGDTTTGKLTISFGTDSGSGSAYMSIQSH